MPFLESHSTIFYAPPLTKAPEPSRLRQRVVTLDALDALLEQGWLYKASLEGGKIIVEKAD